MINGLSIRLIHDIIHDRRFLMYKYFVPTHIRKTHYLNYVNLIYGLHSYIQYTRIYEYMYV